MAPTFGRSFVHDIAWRKRAEHMTGSYSTSEEASLRVDVTPTCDSQHSPSVKSRERILVCRSAFIVSDDLQTLVMNLPLVAFALISCTSKSASAERARHMWTLAKHARLGCSRWRCQIALVPLCGSMSERVMGVVSVASTLMLFECRCVSTKELYS